MPELPEIARLAAQINVHLTGKSIIAIDVIQPKSLNLPVEEFTKSICGATLQGAINRGKWVQIDTTQGWLLLNLGMGGEAILASPGSLPEKRRVVIGFNDGSCLSINFWWFGYLHFAAPGQLENHPMTARLGPNALDIDSIELLKILSHGRGTIKPFLLDQSRLAGIGNAYIHDILFLAGLHPLRKIESLTSEEITKLYKAIQIALRTSLDKGGAFYELDLFGKPGGFTMDDILVGYREGQPCPICGTMIEKLKTGSTTSYICPSCQPSKAP